MVLIVIDNYIYIQPGYMYTYLLPTFLRKVTDMEFFILIINE